RGKPHASLRNTFAIAFLAMATHPLLDFANNYGIRPFLPFSRAWAYGDTLFIIDPYLDLILLVGVVGGYRWSNLKAIATVTGLALATGYVVARVELRNVARAQLTSYLPNVSGLLQFAVLPQMLSPFVWTGMVETDREILNVKVDVVSGKIEPESSIARPLP